MKHISNFIFEALKVTSKSKVSSDADPGNPNTWGEGDVLSGQYGYNMTIPVFYKVIKKTARQFTVVKLSKKLVSGHYNGSFKEIPDDKKLEQDLKGTQYRARINKHNNLVINDVYVHLWDGKPVYGDDMD